MRSSLGKFFRPSDGRTGSRFTAKIDGQAKSPWPVESASASAEPAWEVRPRAGDKPARFVELRPDPRIKVLEQPGKPTALSRFFLKVTECCHLAGHHAVPGDEVECFAGSALQLIENDRVLVVREIRPE